MTDTLTTLAQGEIAAQLKALNEHLERAVDELAQMSAPPLPWTLAIDGDRLTFEEPMTFAEARTWGGILSARFPGNKISIVTV